MKKNAAIAVGMVTAAMLTLTGCPSSPSANVSSASPSGTDQACSFSVKDAIVTPADLGTSRVYGELTNTGSEELVITEALSVVFSGMEFRRYVSDNEPPRREDSWTLQVGASMRWEPTGNFLLGLEYPTTSSSTPTPIAENQLVPIEFKCGNGGTSSFTATAKNLDTNGEDSSGGSSDSGGSGSGGSGNSYYPPSSQSPTYVPSPTYTQTPSYTQSPTYAPTPTKSVAPAPSSSP